VARIDNLTVALITVALALDHVLDRNRSQNTDSDGFLLGAYLGKWLHLDIDLRVGANPQYNTAKAIQLVRRNAIETFAKMRALQKKLGGDDVSHAGLSRIHYLDDYVGNF